MQVFNLPNLLEYTESNSAQFVLGDGKSAMDVGSGDAAEYKFLTTHGARIECRLAGLPDTQELQLLGNRAGLLSLSNVFLWFIANAWRREFFSLGELDFVCLDGPLSVCIRLADDGAVESHGILRRQDRGEMLEWVITEEGLTRVALWMHRLASNPAHEYDRLLVADGSEYGVHVRMSDAID